MNYVNELITSLLIDSLLYKSIVWWSEPLINLLVNNRSVGLSVVYLWVSLSICLSVYLSVCLSVFRCLLLSVYLCVCVSICVFCLSVCLSVVCLAVGRSIYLPFSRSVCLWSICLCACLRASVCLYMSVYLSFSLFVYLSVCCWSVSRSVVSVVFMSCRSVTVCTKRAGSGGECVQTESGMLLIQERRVGLMNVDLRTGAESRGLRARSWERRGLYIRAND